MRFFRRKGFTLLELMIVVIIIGILASLAIPRFIETTKRAKEAEAKSILGTVRSSQIRHNLEHGDYATALGTLDVTIDATTNYYTYSVSNTTSWIGRANGTGDLRNWQIDADGNLSTY